MMGAPHIKVRSLDIRTHLAVVFKPHPRYHDLRSSKTSCVDGKQPSTRSVGMNLARSLEAGIEEFFLDLRRVSDD
jgi:hypothetical protein